MAASNCGTRTWDSLPVTSGFYAFFQVSVTIVLAKGSLHFRIRFGTVTIHNGKFEHLSTLGTSPSNRVDADYEICRSGHLMTYFESLRSGDAANLGNAVSHGTAW